MTPVQRDLLLDRVCGGEGFTRLDPPGQSPDIIPEDAHRFTVVEENGTYVEDLFLEDVQWWRVLAWKCEDRLGNPLDPDDDDWPDLDGDGDDGDPEPLADDSGAGEPE